ncbi:MAG TPA: hypothetical protein VNJ01_07490 [Bacteriovoracaceae bacterium]|nr:hypothetical protein [Bacteriovoracaceae bacterium]
MKKHLLTLAVVSLLGLAMSCNRGGNEQSTQGQDAARMEQQSMGSDRTRNSDTPGATDATMPDSGMQQSPNPSDANRVEE